MEAARRAGIIAAIKPQTASKAQTDKIVIGSWLADTKEKCLNGARGEPRGNEAGDEAQRKQERGPLEHKHHHVRRCAPRAMRIPTSRVRRLTE